MSGQNPESNLVLPVYFELGSNHRTQIWPPPTLMQFSEDDLIGNLKNVTAEAGITHPFPGWLNRIIAIENNPKASEKIRYMPDAVEAYHDFLGLEQPSHNDYLILAIILAKNVQQKTVAEKMPQNNSMKRIIKSLPGWIVTEAGISDEPVISSGHGRSTSSNLPGIAGSSVTSRDRATTSKPEDMDNKDWLVFDPTLDPGTNPDTAASISATLISGVPRGGTLPIALATLLNGHLSKEDPELVIRVLKSLEIAGAVEVEVKKGTIQLGDTKHPKLVYRLTPSDE